MSTLPIWFSTRKNFIPKMNFLFEKRENNLHGKWNIYIIYYL